MLMKCAIVGSYSSLSPELQPAAAATAAHATKQHNQGHAMSSAVDMSVHAGAVTLSHVCTAHQVPGEQSLPHDRLAYNA
jgi:hypothetical protein